MGNCTAHGPYGGSTCPQCTINIQMIRMVKMPEYLEPVIGSAIFGYNLPAAMRIRLLSTVAPKSAHRGILSQGLIPQSMMSHSRGLTPPIDKFAKDARHRIFLGGGISSTVYSNIRSLSETNPEWMKSTKNLRFQCAFLFRPTLGIFQYPLIVIVPENLFMTNFMKDDFSIVKICRERFFGFSNTVQIPGAVKSVENFTLAPHYFLASTHFNPQAVMAESMQREILNPTRFLRGLSFTGIGAAIVFNWYRRPAPSQERI